jgi:DNA-binding FadR family transcriptional regulator
MKFKKVNRKRAYMEIVDQVQDLISSGEVKQGDKLPTEQELALQFGVARPTVREAFSALEVLGLIDVRVGSGAYITGVPSSLSAAKIEQVDGESPIDLYEVRMSIEPFAAGKAAENASDQAIDEIEKTLQAMEEQLEKTGFSFELDRLFHLQIAQASGNKHLVEIVRYITNQMSRTPYLHFSKKNIQIRGHVERVIEDHKKTSQAIRQRNPRSAESSMLAHLKDVAIREKWD